MLSVDLAIVSRVLDLRAKVHCGAVLDRPLPSLAARSEREREAQPQISMGEGKMLIASH